jgi:hypothetical protein
MKRGMSVPGPLTDMMLEAQDVRFGLESRPWTAVRSSPNEGLWNGGTVQSLFVVFGCVCAKQSWTPILLTDVFLTRQSGGDRARPA